MGHDGLLKDPYNVVITGVGGQGNVMASRILGEMLVREGYRVVIGETFGASQRGGSVMSHLRVSESSSWSPQMPRGLADIIVALEPTEALRMCKDFAHAETMVLSNTRPVHPVAVITGEADYPDIEEIKNYVQMLAGVSWFIDATEEAAKLGNPLLSNMMMLGALSELGPLVLDRENFAGVVSEILSKDALGMNLRAFDAGVRKVSGRRSH